jgi:ubiquinone biosynthesis protein
MSEQVGWRALRRHVESEAITWAKTLPQVPRLAHQVLTRLNQTEGGSGGADLQAPLRRVERLLAVVVALLALLFGAEAWRWFAG